MRKIRAEKKPEKNDSHIFYGVQTILRHTVRNYWKWSERTNRMAEEREKEEKKTSTKQ